MAVNEDPNKVLILELKAEIERLRQSLLEKDMPSPSRLRSELEHEYSKRLEEEKKAIKDKVDAVLDA